MHQIIKLDIDGMGCAGCADRVQVALVNIPGVERVAVALRARIATAVYDPALAGVSEFEAAIRDLGLRASLRPADANEPGWA